MFDPINIPFGAKMFFNLARLNSGVSFDDIEAVTAELCGTIKEIYGGDKGGFIGGQVLKYSGIVDLDSRLLEIKEFDKDPKLLVAFVCYWQSFAQHEKSYADAIIQEKLGAFAKFCGYNYEVGYEMLWQG